MEVYADYTDVGKGERHRGVTWLNYREYDPSRVPDVFIAWRYSVSAGGLCPQSPSLLDAPPTPKHDVTCLLWLHDIVPASILPESLHRLSRGGPEVTKLLFRPLLLVNNKVELFQLFVSQGKSTFRVVVPSIFFKQTKIPMYLQNITEVVVNGLSAGPATEHRSSGEADEKRRSVFAYAR